MVSLFGTNEFWAAVVGGLFTLVGSSASSWLQYYFQVRDKSRAAEAFFRDQVLHFDSMTIHIENYYYSNGEIWFEYINTIERSYDVINRNVESLTFIKNSQLRTDLRVFFANIFFMSKRAAYWQNVVYQQVEKAKNQDIAGLPAQAAAELEVLKARQQVKDCVLELKRLRLSVPSAMALKKGGNA